MGLRPLILCRLLWREHRLAAGSIYNRGGHNWCVRCETHFTRR